LRRAIHYALLILGLSCLGVYGFTFLESAASQAYAKWVFERTPRSPPKAAAIQGRIAPLPSRILLQPEAIIGRISIPNLKLSAMVREGADTKTLRIAVGHIPSTALPGQPGNVGVAAHRDTFFRHLGELKNGDTIGFSTVDGDFTYRVESLKIVEPENIEVLASSDEKVLTMVTCYPFHYIGNAPHRYIVRAKQVPNTSR
jgi:sortase A